MTQAPAPPCQRFVDYLADPQIATTHEILAHVQSCPACLAEMTTRQEASQDLFHDAKFEHELTLARKLYQRQRPGSIPNQSGSIPNQSGSIPNQSESLPNLFGSNPK